MTAFEVSVSNDWLFLHYFRHPVRLIVDDIFTVKVNSAQLASDRCQSRLFELKAILLVLS